MASHSIEQWHDSIWKPKSASILLEIFSKPSYSFRTWTVWILPPYHQFKGLIKRKVLTGCGMKRVPSDSITFLFLSSYFCVCITCVFYFQILSQSSFYTLLCLTCFCCFFFNFALFCFSFKNIKKFWKIRKIQKQYVFCVHWYLCTLDGHWNKIF